MELYFGNIVSIISTIMVCLAIGYIIYTAIHHKRIEHWGRRVGLFALYGLVLCCFVATRDEYYLSVKASIDHTTQAGLFSVESIQSTLCCIAGGVIAFASLSSIFIRNQKYRKIMFFILSSVMIFKTVLIELSRGLC